MDDVVPAIEHIMEHHDLIFDLQHTTSIDVALLGEAERQARARDHMAAALRAHGQILAACEAAIEAAEIRHAAMAAARAWLGRWMAPAVPPGV